MKHIVYMATNKVNGKRYIGCTSLSLKRRKIQHNSESKKPKYYFHYAIKKYGFSKFKFEILWKSSNKKDMFDTETKFIQHYQTNNPEYGYNLSCGGEGNVGWAGHSKEKHPMVKLNWDAVKAMREKYSGGGINQVDLAKEYSVTKATIWEVLQNRQWVDNNYNYKKQKRIGGRRGKV